MIMHKPSKSPVSQCPEYPDHECQLDQICDLLISLVNNFSRELEATGLNNELMLIVFDNAFLFIAALQYHN